MSGLLVFIVFKKPKKSNKKNQNKNKQNQQPGINIINNSIDYAYKCIHLMNKSGRKKNIIWIEFTESLYKLYYNTF